MIAASRQYSSGGVPGRGVTPSDRSHVITVSNSNPFTASIRQTTSSAARQSSS